MDTLIFKGIFGSHLYSLDTEDSDMDYKAVFIPDYRDIILGKASKNITQSTGRNDSKNNPDDIDMETFSLQEFVKLACQGQTVAIDMLHTPLDKEIVGSPVWDYLVVSRHKFYSKNMNAFMGYVKEQAAKYGIKGSKLAVLEEIIKICDVNLVTNKKMGYDGILLDIAELLPITEYTSWHSNFVPIRVNPNDSRVREEKFYVVNGSMMHDVIPLQEFRNRIQKQYDNYGERAILAKDNNGIDWKAVSHALRAGYQLKDIFEKGDFEYPLKQTQFLLDVKQGKLDYVNEVAPVLEVLVGELERLSQESDLPDEVDTDLWDNFVYDVYTGNFKSI